MCGHLTMRLAGADDAEGALKRQPRWSFAQQGACLAFAAGVHGKKLQSVC